MKRLPALYPHHIVAEAWPRLRANWLIEMEHVMLGTAPNDRAVRAETLASEPILDGAGIRETVRVFYAPGFKASFDAVIARPAREGRFPVITWNQFADDGDCPALNEAIARGYAVAAFKRDQLFEDKENGGTAACDAYGDGFTWRGIRAWAFGHSKLLDYLETTDYADKAKFVATGHSRGGKAALAAGAYDERFAVTAPNNSGCGGAGCFRVLAGRDGKLEKDATRVETLGRIATKFPYWFADGFARYGGEAPYFPAGNEENLRFDLHTLKATVAPRHLVTLEGLDDAWSNPFGTYISWRAAQPAFDLLSAGDRNNVYYREGGHGFHREDWLALLDYCDKAFYGKRVQTVFNNAPFTV